LGVISSLSRVERQTQQQTQSKSIDFSTPSSVKTNAPSSGECVPLRVFLKPYPLTPTYRATNKFTVKYFLNLVLVDEEDRR